MSFGKYPPFVFGTKAETLQRLKLLLAQAVIPNFHFFTVKDWKSSPDTILDTLTTIFKNETLVVRSSALLEDGIQTSMAGAFLSLLNVKCNDRLDLLRAIDRVAESMMGDDRDQVLIQTMVDNVVVSGVIMTYDMVHGAPYFCIEFDDESGRTDLVTGGNGVHKSLFVYRYANDSMIRSTRIAAFLSLARELEEICGCAALDIEFTMSHDGHLHLLQVRRISATQKWHPVTERRVRRQLAFVENFVRERSRRRDGILGERTILAVMPDWNPAEMIGTTPRSLSASLYRYLITSSVWHRARALMGYRKLQDAELMVLINSHPYVDVRNSFNSFLPAQLSEAIGEKLVNAQLDRLETYPELHDKVEFEIVSTCLDFCFEDDFFARYPNVLDAKEFQVFRNTLRDITCDFFFGNTLAQALAESDILAAQRFHDISDNEAVDQLARANYLLVQCRNLGSLPFAIVARHAFVAEALLRSATKRLALSEQRLADFKQSIQTVTGSMVVEYSNACQDHEARSGFLQKYGHLRPGTYEITSLRYDERDDLFFDEVSITLPNLKPASFSLTEEERASINLLIKEAGLNVLDADRLLDYARKAIAGREYVKFVFTRALSDALSAIVKWGGRCGLSREDISHLEWPDIAKSLIQPVMDDVDRHYLISVENGRRNIAAAHAFKLAHIICRVRDIYVATLNRSVPNFVGVGSVTGRVFLLDANTPASINIRNHIICIESADPGFDWIFTKGPIALITQFGGANSHMAIRCAELGIPAAIGCGDQLFQRLIAAGNVELNCEQKIVRPIYAE